MALPEAGESAPRFVGRWTRAVGADVWHRHAPVTTGLVAFVVALFVQQVAAARFAGVAVADVAGHLFAEQPLWAWTLSAFVHRGALHFGTNVVLLLVLGRVVEDSMRRGPGVASAWRSYLGLLLAAAAGSTAGGALLTAPFTSSPIAVYGASGLGYALATYSLWLPVVAADGAGSESASDSPSTLREQYRLERLVDGLRPGEELALLVGVAAVVNVCLDVLTGPYFTAYWINGGHAAGAVVGLLVGWWHWSTVGER